MSQAPSDRTILQQGQLDGFCLLYALLNAFSAACPNEIENQLTKDRHTLWARLISVTPSLQNFASFGSVLSELPNKHIDIAIKRLLSRQYAEVLSDWLSHESGGVHKQLNIEPVSIDTPKWYRAVVQEPMAENRSYIACLREKAGTLKYGETNEHWVAVVGSTGDELAVACSYTSHHPGRNYREWTITKGKKKRRYNNLIACPLTHEHVYVDSRYELTLS